MLQVRLIASLLRCPPSRERYASADRGALPRYALYFVLSAECACPLTHRSKPHMPRGHIADGKPDAVVFDLQRHEFAFGPQGYFHSTGLGMFHDVVQRFLRDPVK